MEKIPPIHLVYFSPTRTSAKVGWAIAQALCGTKYRETDMTYPRELQTIPVIHPDSIVIFAAPVYAGRIPPVALQRFRRIKGTKNYSILVVVYGNRAYEDALLELRDEAVRMGFIPIAAGAFIGEHSFSTPEMPVAPGRPDLNDLQVAAHFGKDILQKIQRKSLEFPFSVPGNRPYREMGSSAVTVPVSEEGCTGCEGCFPVCPTQAMFRNKVGYVQTNPDACIQCCACVRACPSGIRRFHSPFKAYLYEHCTARQEIELFL